MLHVGRTPWGILHLFASLSMRQQLQAAGPGPGTQVGAVRRLLFGSMVGFIPSRRCRVCCRFLRH